MLVARMGVFPVRIIRNRRRDGWDELAWAGRGGWGGKGALVMTGRGALVDSSICI